jgi:hypothetical protein
MVKFNKEASQSRDFAAQKSARLAQILHCSDWNRRRPWELPAAGSIKLIRLKMIENE